MEAQKYSESNVTNNNSNENLKKTDETSKLQVII